jgi:uncharacterized protein YqgC (DUF456 family)
MGTLLIVLGFILIFGGLLGCVLPLIPGPPLSFLALILMSLAKNWQAYSPKFLIGMGIFTGVVSVIDYVTPILGAKRFGASRAGIWGSVAGLLLGTVFLPPFGMFLGAFLGALIGEYLMGRRTHEALRASWGVFWGTLLGLGLKLTASGIMAYYFVKALFI